ncbi:NAD(+) diphosphatase [Furfurilactobacillus sp. WILCCON 0119]
MIVLVADEFDDVALVKMPYLSTDYKSLISGYMKPGETAEQAAIREVDEELGISLDHVAYAGTYWFSKTETLMHGYTAVTSKQPLTKSAELAVADWIPKQDVLQQMFPDSPDNAAVAIFKQYFASTK